MPQAVKNVAQATATNENFSFFLMVSVLSFYC
ncbi:hypothetical protein SSU98_0157 [Streptococcus suis 98HAH33]|nr:hypothetical protein SSU05_0154 [Streptococcus suis 05ZYH33]ABP91316.1 hypothetical protein SSU98_0157 [Streptococcus suis 98HAH33]